MVYYNLKWIKFTLWNFKCNTYLSYDFSHHLVFLPSLPFIIAIIFSITLIGNVPLKSLVEMSQILKLEKECSILKLLVKQWRELDLKTTTCNSFSISCQAGYVSFSLLLPRSKSFQVPTFRGRLWQWPFQLITIQVGIP